MRIRKHLAITGGSKTVNPKNAYYIWPPITKKIESAVIRQLHDSISIYNKSGIIEKFENSWAKYHRRKYGILFNSGTQAIHSMFIASGVKAGDEVICPAYTFFATVTPLLFTGAKPVLCDCDKNGNIDPNKIEQGITRKTRAVIVTHMWGVPCQLEKISRICKKYKLLLLEDCSHAHGAKYRDKTVGSFGDMAAWSIQGPKNITGGEGGIMITSNSEFYYSALTLGHYNKRCKAEIPKNHWLSKYAVTGMGFKYRSHPLAVAIAYEIFKDIDKHLKVRRKFAKKIIKELSGIPGLLLPKPQSFIKPSWYGFIIQYNAEGFNGLPIEKFFSALEAEGLTEIDRPGSTSPLNLLPLFQNPTKLFPSYKKNPFSYKRGDFPNAEKFYNNAIKMPVWASVKDQKIIDIYIKAIKKVSKYYYELL